VTVVSPPGAARPAARSATRGRRTPRRSRGVGRPASRASPRTLADSTSGSYPRSAAAVAAASSVRPFPTTNAALRSNAGSPAVGVSGSSPSAPARRRSRALSGASRSYRSRTASASAYVVGVGDGGPARDRVERVADHVADREGDGRRGGAARANCPPFTAEQCFRTALISSIDAPDVSSADVSARRSPTEMGPGRGQQRAAPAGDDRENEVVGAGALGRVEDPPSALDTPLARQRMIAREHVDRRGRRRVTRAARPSSPGVVRNDDPLVDLSVAPAERAPATPAAAPAVAFPAPRRTTRSYASRSYSPPAPSTPSIRRVPSRTETASRISARERAASIPAARQSGPPRVSVSERVARGRETSRRRRSSRRHRSWRWLSAERHISGAGRTIRPAGYGYRSLVASRCALAAIAAIRRGSGRRNPRGPTRRPRRRPRRRRSRPRGRTVVPGHRSRPSSTRRAPPEPEAAGTDTCRAARARASPSNASRGAPVRARGSPRSSRRTGRSVEPREAATGRGG